MDEICLIPPPLSSSLQASELFLKICHDQHIFITLFEFIGFSAFIELSATNSKVAQAVNKHEEVQVRLLRIKVKKLKEREFKRQFPNFLRVDLNLFNPFLLPPYEEDVELEPVLNLQEREKQKAMIEAQKIHGNEFVRKRVWGKWRANKKAELMLGTKREIQQSNISKTNENAMKMEMNVQEKMKTIQEAEAVLNLKYELRRKIIQEFPETKNKLEDMRNRHFAESLLGQKISKTLIKKQVSQKPKIKAQRPQKTKMIEDEVWEVKIKQLMIEQVQKKRKAESQTWLPLKKTMVKNGIDSILESPAIVVKILKQNISTFLYPHQN